MKALAYSGDDSGAPCAYQDITFHRDRLSAVFRECNVYALRGARGKGNEPCLSLVDALIQALLDYRVFA